MVNILQEEAASSALHPRYKQVNVSIVIPCRVSTPFKGTTVCSAPGRQGHLYTTSPWTNFSQIWPVSRFLVIYVAFFKRDTVWWSFVRDLRSLVEGCAHLETLEVGINGVEKLKVPYIPFTDRVVPESFIK